MTSLKSRLFRLSGLNSLYSKRSARSISKKEREEKSGEREGEGGDEIQTSLFQWLKLVRAKHTALGLLGHCYCELMFTLSVVHTCTDLNCTDGA